MQVQSETLSSTQTATTQFWARTLPVQDDWRGVTDPVERKKKQNRINQRTFRRKRAARNSEQPCRQSFHLNDVDAVNGASLLACPLRVARTREATEAAYRAHMLNLPRPTNLHVLIRLNLLHALARNATLMGFAPEGLCNDDFVSPYNVNGPRLPHVPVPLAHCPEALAPIELQRTVVHHPWTDLFPFPQFRARILQALEAGTLHEDELCLDILEVDGHDLAERPALIVWGDSSDPQAWEASALFLRKWGWFVQGCPELLESTNYWREKRQQRKLLLQA